VVVDYDISSAVGKSIYEPWIWRVGTICMVYLPLFMPYRQITRTTLDEEDGRHRKFALGAHELVFNPFQDMIGKEIFTPVFRTFITCEIPSYCGLLRIGDSADYGQRNGPG
jgi:hypothetical protein